MQCSSPIPWAIVPGLSMVHWWNRAAHSLPLQVRLYNILYIVYQAINPNATISIGNLHSICQHMQSSSLFFQLYIVYIYSICIVDSTRLLFATWWIFITILTSFYTANLTAFLTLSKFTLPYNTVNDILTKNKHFVSLRGGGVEYAIRTVSWKLLVLFTDIRPHHTFNRNSLLRVIKCIKSCSTLPLYFL